MQTHSLRVSHLAYFWHFLSVTRAIHCKLRLYAPSYILFKLGWSTFDGWATWRLNFDVFPSWSVPKGSVHTDGCWRKYGWSYPTWRWPHKRTLLVCRHLSAVKIYPWWSVLCSWSAAPAWACTLLVPKVLLALCRNLHGSHWPIFWG